MIVQVVTIVLENTFTTDDLSERLALLKAYLQLRLFGDDADRKHSLESFFTEQSVPNATQHALKEWLDVFDERKLTLKTVYDSLDDVEEEVKGIPQVTLYVPKVLSNESYGKLCTWFRTNVQQNLLLSVRVDVAVTGGCGVVWNNVYHDLSFRYFMRKHKKDIVNMFETYAGVQQ